MKILQNEIHWCKLPLYSNKVLTKTRPCIILSNSKANEKSTTVQVCPITNTYKRPELPCHVITQYGMIKLEQIITIDRDCVMGKIGDLTFEELREFRLAMLIQLGVL